VKDFLANTNSSHNPIQNQNNDDMSKGWKVQKDEEKKENSDKNEDAKMEDELTKDQERMIDNDINRKLRRERGLDGGIKVVREKVAFIW
jgi:hypothetical protein